MIRLVVLCLALVSGASAASAAVSAACSLYKVNTSLLNISKEAGGHIYIDVLEDGEIACVTREQKVDGQDWGYIAYKVEKSNKQTQVDGWSTLRTMKKLSPAEAAAFGAGTAAPASAAAPPAAKAAPPAPGAAAPAAAPEREAVAMRPEDTLRFDQPIPFGAFPAVGHSIKELIETLVPLFPPIEGLDDAVWKRNCTACHKWNQARLCEQANTYVKNPRNVLRISHPDGGPLKVALMRWAKSGCL